MCFTRLQHFVCFSLILCAIQKSFDSRIVVYSTPFNTSEEIKNIFRSIHASNHTFKPFLKDTLPTENFAEGGVAHTIPNTHTGSSTVKPTLKETVWKSKPAQTSSSLKTETSTALPKDVIVNENTSISTSTPSYKFSSLTKLNETETNLFLGVPEVIHVNGTSSIKPRKGVFYNKIVPRKGVDNENETVHSFLNNHSCFWISKEECYSALDFSNTKCNCCKEGNLLGETIKGQSLLNCSNCSPLSSHPLGDKNCEKICCVNISHEQSISSDSTVENSVSRKPENGKTEFSQIKGLEKNTPKRLLLEKNKINVTLGSESRSKPTITKVPYDVDVTDTLIESKKQVFVPVVVSVFILPLLGILVFFIWRRTKEYWEKRYYKRMDFLIDGMYND